VPPPQLDRARVLSEPQPKQDLREFEPQSLHCRVPDRADHESAHCEQSDDRESRQQHNHGFAAAAGDPPSHRRSIGVSEGTRTTDRLDRNLVAADTGGRR
jgi:hypothetical protein